MGLRSMFVSAAKKSVVATRIATPAVGRAIKVSAKFTGRITVSGAKATSSLGKDTWSAMKEGWNQDLTSK